MYDARPLPLADRSSLWKIGDVAIALLRELAQHDPAIARQAEEQGLDLDLRPRKAG